MPRTLAREVFSAIRKVAEMGYAPGQAHLGRMSKRLWPLVTTSISPIVQRMETAEKVQCVNRSFFVSLVGCTKS